MTQEARKTLRGAFPYAFQSDAELSKNYVFQFIWNLMRYVVIRFFSMTLVGAENLNRDESYLFIAMHSAHNQDILSILMLFYLYTGKIIRGLIHRIIYKTNFWARYVGFVPGSRDIAIELLSDKGQWAACIPGGGEEAIYGSENAYNLHWKSNSGRRRTGWAHVAKQTRVKVVPVSGQNIQEMMFNPLQYLVNVTGFSKFYDHLAGLPGFLGWIFIQLRMCLWFCTSFCAIPMPVKTTIIVCEPLEIGENESIDDFVDRVESVFQKSLNVNNPGGLNISRALAARFFSHEKLH